jgi:nitroreductase
VRETLGSAIAKVEGLSGSDAERLAAKPLRAPLLIAVVARHQPSEKVPRWEQSAVASGVAHVLSLLLNDAGWGVIWRTGHYVRAKKIAELHGLAKNERLLGWLYVGGIPDETKPGRKQPIEAGEFLTVLEP